MQRSILKSYDEDFAKHADPDITLPASERPIGGLGILMVRKMSNPVTYSREQGRNVMSATIRF